MAQPVLDLLSASLRPSDGARSSSVRLGFCAGLPTVAAMRARVADLARQAVAAGRDPDDLRVLVEVEVVLAADERDARLRRSRLEHLDALAGLTWSPAPTRVVTTADRVLAEVRELVARTGADGALLVSLNHDPAARRALLDLVA